jgi:hypothetical protein
LQNRPVVNDVHTEDPQVQDSAFAKDPLLMGQLANEQVLVDNSHSGPIFFEHTLLPHWHAPPMFGDSLFVYLQTDPTKHKHSRTDVQGVGEAALEFKKSWSPASSPGL